MSDTAPQDVSESRYYDKRRLKAAPVCPDHFTPRVRYMSDTTVRPASILRVPTLQDPLLIESVRFPLHNAQIDIIVVEMPIVSTRLSFFIL